MSEQNNIRTLTHREQSREKLPVYFGSNDNYLHPVREVVINARDILQSIKNAEIKVILHEDNKTITVIDNGLGIPMNGETDGIPNYELLFLTLFSGTKMDSGGTDGGTNGCGNTVICYTSDYFEVTSKRNGKEYNIAFENGGSILKPFSCVGDTNETGTTITFRLSDQVYTNTLFNPNDVAEIVEKACATSNNIKGIFIYKDNIKTYNYPNLESYLNSYIEENIVEYIYANENKQYENDTKNKNTGQMELEKTTINFILSIDKEKTTQHSFLNGIYLPERGTIHDGFINGVRNQINKFIKDNAMYEKKEKQISTKDVEDTISYVVSVLSTHVSYSNQTKFSTQKELYKEYTQDYISNFLEIYFIENKNEALKIATSILISKRAREKAESIRTSTKKKLENEIKFTDDIKNFKPCQSKDKNLVELYINEGSSALGGMLQSRNSIFQAGFHVGGKMKSLLKATEKSLFSNEVVNNLYKVLGCGTVLSKSKFNKEKLPPYDFNNLLWNKIIISTDQDIDAYQIRCLILCSMYVMSPDLIERGVVHIAEAPLYEITLKEKNNEGNYDVIFAYTDKERDDIISDLKSKGIKFNTPERNKGLGEMEKFSMAKAIMNPNTRRITKVTVSDVEKMMQFFELWLGEDVENRREVITTNFDYIEHFEDKTEKDIVEVLNENYLPYAIDMVKNRAIISVDGFKPAHRKLLWTLHEKGLYGKRTKSANIVGDNMAYNVHGDGSIYQTLVRMAQDDTLLYPYVNGKGNFGKHTSKDLDEAHMRYTEAGASDINKEFFKDINKNAVDLLPNFDGQKKEPSILPTTFPNLLVNYNTGIAVGMASTTPSFPLIDVCNLTIEYIKNTDIDVLNYLSAPDFATGGYIVYDKEELNKIYNLGSGSVTLRAKYIVDDNSIIITEIPYTTSIEAIVDKIKELCKGGDSNYKCITNVLDSTELKGMSITITVKKNTDIDKIMTLLYSKTPLQSKQPFNMNIICMDGMPRVLGIKQMLDEWLTFRRQCVCRVLQYDINQKSDKLHLLKGLEKVLLDIDKAIEIIRYTKEENIISELISYFHIDNIQADEVANMKLRYINRDYILNKVKDIKSLEYEILVLQNTLTNPNAIDDIIIKDLKRVRDTYGKERKTDIIYPHEIQEISADELIPNHSTTIVFTKEQYIKKTLRYADKDKQGVKEGDEVISLIQTTNRAEVMLLSNQGNCYKLKVNDLQERQPSALGQYLPTLLNLDKDEKLIGMLATSDFKGYAVISFKNGKISKIPLQSYSTKNNRLKLQNSLNLDSPVVSILQITEDTDIYLESSQNKALIINTSNINEKAARNSQGITIMKSNKQGFEVVKAEIYNNQVDESYRVNSTSAGKSLGC